jgi:hypothetical protein
MKKYIYSPHHQGLVLAPLMTEPTYESCRPYPLKDAMQAYNTWLSSPPVYKVREEDIEWFSVERGEDEFEVVKRNHPIQVFGGMTYYEERTVAIPKKGNERSDFLKSWIGEPMNDEGNESKEQSPSVEQGGDYYYELFKFFSDEHGLTLLDSEIQDIIQAVNKFQSVEAKESKPYTEGYNEKHKGWIALYKDEQEFNSYLKWKYSQESKEQVDSQIEARYTEAEVVELLRQQRELCAASVSWADDCTRDVERYIKNTPIPPLKSSLNQKQPKGLPSGDWYLNEHGNRITVLSVADGWCMVREGYKKPFVVPEEFVLGTFDKATAQ